MALQKQTRKKISFPNYLIEFNMLKTIANATSYCAPKAKVVDIHMTATLCQTSNWATETDPEEDQLP